MDTDHRSLTGSAIGVRVRLGVRPCNLREVANVLTGTRMRARLKQPGGVNRCGNVRRRWPTFCWSQCACSSAAGQPAIRPTPTTSRPCHRPQQDRSHRELVDLVLSHRLQSRGRAVLTLTRCWQAPGCCGRSKPSIVPCIRLSRPVQPRHRGTGVVDRQSDVVLHTSGARHRPAVEPRGRLVRRHSQCRHQPRPEPSVPPRHRRGHRHPVPDRAGHHRRGRPAQDQRPRAAPRLLATATTSA